MIWAYIVDRKLNFNYCDLLKATYWEVGDVDLILLVKIMIGFFGSPHDNGRCSGE